MEDDRMADQAELFTAVTAGKRNDVQRMVNELLENGVPAEALVTDTMIPAMREVGDRFSRNEVFVPEMLIAARAMQAGLSILEPLLAQGGHQPLGRVAVGTVKGDLHDIGKNLVAMMLKGAGYEVIDLGVDCDEAKYEEGVAQGATVLLASALLTTTMPYMKQLVDHFAGRPDVKIVLGGAPVTQQYADQVGAHGYGKDANDAVVIVDRIFKRG
jgi:5-methyltetrahydrofolate--homocysteine methyltransferase